jgi:uncharacterized protein (TIGR02246 family)
MLRHSLRSTCLLVLIAAGCAAPAPATTTPDAPDPAAVRATIEATEKQWSAAYLKGDMAALSALYTDDGASIMPAGEWARGREAVGKSIQATLDTVNVTAREDVTEEVTVAGDYAVEIGSYSWTGTAKKGGKAVGEKGRYMVLWKKGSDGTWKLHRDIGSAAAPSAP